MGLSRCLGMLAEYWVNLQSTYDLRMAEMNSGKRIARESQKWGNYGLMHNTPGMK